MIGRWVVAIVALVPEMGSPVAIFVSWCLDTVVGVSFRRCGVLVRVVGWDVEGRVGLVAEMRVVVVVAVTVAIRHVPAILTVTVGRIFFEEL